MAESIKLPNANITEAFTSLRASHVASSLLNRVSDEEGITISEAANERRNKLEKSETEFKIHTKNQYENLYGRGINILRPEILMTCEYIPLTMHGLIDDASSSLKAKISDNREINVNQVAKLIELHKSVQKSMNLKAINLFGL